MAPLWKQLKEQAPGGRIQERRLQETCSNMYSPEERKAHAGDAGRHPAICQTCLRTFSTEQGLGLHFAWIQRKRLTGGAMPSGHRRYPKKQSHR